MLRVGALALCLFAFMKEDGTLATYIRCGLAAEATPWVAAAAAAAIRLGWGKRLHLDSAQTAHHPSRPKAEVAGLKFGGR